jgi:hypothetical protein
MGFRDWLTRPFARELELYKNATEKEIQDLKASLSVERERARTFEQEVKTRRRTLQKPIQYATSNTSSIGTSRDKNIYYGPLYDLSEIARAVDIEPYINQSIRKHREQVLKEGYMLDGEEEEMISYIRKRLFEMFLVSGVTTEEWLREFTTNLITYATALLVVKRDVNKSTGSAIRWHGKRLDPIAAVFPLDPTSVKVKLNNHGHPVEWLQEVNDPVGNKTHVRFQNSEIIIATIDKKAGFVFGTPFILPVLDDVRALRRIEELAEIIGQKHAFPNIHWQVGDKDDPPIEYEDGTTEIATVRSEVENAPTEGGIVTSHRVNASVIGLADHVIDLQPYLQYFEKRVMAGLRLSPEDLGRSEGAKASAVTVSESLQDSSKDFQSVIGDSLTFKLILPLLLEGEFNVNIDNLVSLTFPMINREEERARQSHGTDMFNSGVLSRTELRRDFLGREQLSEEECKDCKSEMDHEREMELAKLNAQMKKQEAAARKVSNTTRPSNQSGRKATKTRVKANDIHKEIYGEVLASLFTDAADSLKEFFSVHGTGVVDTGSDPYDVSTKSDQLDGILEFFVTQSMIEARRLLTPILSNGAVEAMEDMEVEGDFKAPKKAIDRFFKNTIEKMLKEFAVQVVDHVKNSDVLAGAEEGNLYASLSTIVDLQYKALKCLSDKHIDLSHRFGYSRAAKSHGYNTIKFSPDESNACERCLDDGDILVSLAIKDIPYRTLLDTHRNCEFSIVLGDKEVTVGK